MPGNHNDIKKRLCGAADELRATSKLKASEYSLPVLGLISLKYADFKPCRAEQGLKVKGSERRPIGKLHYQAQGVLLAGACTKLESSTLLTLLKTFNIEQSALDGESLFQKDAFGRIYEHFLSNFARAEGQKGGEFFTPTSLVRLIYDNLIENNTRCIKILEEMVQALYREWFVHFRFPVHEKVRMAGSPLGRIPERWQIKKLGRITNTKAASLKNGNSSVPAKDLMDLLHLITEDFMTVKRDLVEKNEIFRFVRDLMHPKLINGRIVNEIFLSEENN